MINKSNIPRVLTYDHEDYKEFLSDERHMPQLEDLIATFVFHSKGEEGYKQLINPSTEAAASRVLICKEKSKPICSSCNHFDRMRIVQNGSYVAVSSITGLLSIIELMISVVSIQFTRRKV